LFLSRQKKKRSKNVDREGQGFPSKEKKTKKGALTVEEKRRRGRWSFMELKAEGQIGGNTHKHSKKTTKEEEEREFGRKAVLPAVVHPKNRTH